MRCQIERLILGGAARLFLIQIWSAIAGGVKGDVLPVGRPDGISVLPRTKRESGGCVASQVV